MRNLIVIEGTNASGKSGLGVALASRFGGEVVSADSRQVFRGLDLGSGKITLDEMRGVPHHLLDVCEPGCFFSMADYQRLAMPPLRTSWTGGSSRSSWAAPDCTWIRWRTDTF